jgi:hypothetical protein
VHGGSPLPQSRVKEQTCDQACDQEENSCVIDLLPDVAVANVNAFTTDFLALYRICHDDTSVAASLKARIRWTQWLHNIKGQ